MTMRTRRIPPAADHQNDSLQRETTRTSRCIDTSSSEPVPRCRNGMHRPNEKQHTERISVLRSEQGTAMVPGKLAFADMNPRQRMAKREPWQDKDSLECRCGGRVSHADALT